MKNKNLNLAYYLIGPIIEIIFGILFMFFADELFRVLLIIFGVLVIISSLPAFIAALTGDLRYGGTIALLVISLISIVLGLLLIFIPNDTFLIIAGIWLLIDPVCHLILDKDKVAVIKNQSTILAIGIILIVIGATHSLEKVSYIVGIIMIVLALLDILIVTIAYFKAKKIKKDSEAIDA